MRKSSVAVIVLNWNDAELLAHSVGSLLGQNESCDILIVDNGSTDHSREVIESFQQKVIPLWNKKNRGFAGGVNTGIRFALQSDYEYIALLNNDAVAHKDWVKHLRARLARKPHLGGVSCAMVHASDNTYDSTGEQYTNWGLSFPRGRGETVSSKYSSAYKILGVSGGASMYRADFFKDVGLFDEDFFAYYEDIDLSLRGQLKGWEFAFVPKAEVSHATGSTTQRVKGFTTYQTFKNLPWLITKNIPLGLLPGMLVRFGLAYMGFLVSAFQRRQLRFAIKGIFVSLALTPKKFVQRIKIQRTRTISAREFSELLTHDLPPDATKLRALRMKYWKLTGRKT